MPLRAASSSPAASRNQASVVGPRRPGGSATFGVSPRSSATMARPTSARGWPGAIAGTQFERAHHQQAAQVGLAGGGVEDRARGGPVPALERAAGGDVAVDGVVGRRARLAARQRQERARLPELAIGALVGVALVAQ